MIGSYEKELFPGEENVLSLSLLGRVDTWRATQPLEMSTIISAAHSLAKATAQESKGQWLQPPPSIIATPLQPSTTHLEVTDNDSPSSLLHRREYWTIQQGPSY